MPFPLCPALSCVAGLATPCNGLIRFALKPAAWRAIVSLSVSCDEGEDTKEEYDLSHIKLKLWRPTTRRQIPRRLDDAISPRIALPARS